MPQKVDRLSRVNTLLKQELANALEKYLHTPAGMLVSITEVNASVDLRNATVHVSLFGGAPADRREVMEELQNIRCDLQKMLGRTLGFKHTPVLLFKQDLRQERGDRVLAILNGEEPK